MDKPHIVLVRQGLYQAIPVYRQPDGIMVIFSGKPLRNERLYKGFGDTPAKAFEDFVRKNFMLD